MAKRESKRMLWGERWKRFVVAAICLFVSPFLAIAQTGAMDDRLDNWDSSSLSADREENGIKFDSNAIDQAHRRFIKNPSYQKERPVDLKQPDLPDFELREPRGGNASLNLGWLGHIMPVIFWGLVAAIALWALYGLIKMFIAHQNADKDAKGKSSNKNGDDIYVDVRPEKETARTLLEEAEQLAKSGKFAEAVHLLLFRSIEDIQKKLEGGVPKSLTAREIGSLSSIPQLAQTALSPIIMIVEGSYFGQRHVTEADWNTAKCSYEQFAFGEFAK